MMYSLHKPSFLVRIILQACCNRVICHCFNSCSSAAPLIQCNLWWCVESVKSVRKWGYSRLYWFTYAYIRLCFITLKIWNSELGASHNVGLICCCLESVKSVIEWGYNSLCKTPCSELKIKTICCKASCILYCKTLWSAFNTINVDDDGNDDDITKFNNKSCVFHYTITWSWNVFNGNMSSQYTSHPWQVLTLMQTSYL